MAVGSKDIQLLQACADENGPSEFRIDIAHESIKYLTIDHGLYDVTDMCFGPSLISMLPDLPPGDWNEGFISADIATGKPHFSKVVKTELPGITSIWHPLHIDHRSLQIGDKLRTNVYEATHPHFDNSQTTIIAKFARFSWEIPQLEDETAAYQWISSCPDIGPTFLGHLSEEGRVIGFLIERIPNARHATLEDLPKCQEVLGRLHGLGVKHGDINKHNFLIRGDDDKAVLIDFDAAVRCDDETTLREEMGRLEQELRDTSGRGGTTTIESDDDA